MEFCSRVAVECPFLRAGQAVKSTRPKNNFGLPCEHSPALSLIIQRYEYFIARLSCPEKR